VAKIRLSDACHRLGVPYQRLYRAALGARIPAERSENGTFWLVAENDLPAIAQTLGVELPDIKAA
jgi:hypothetical protein